MPSGFEVDVARGFDQRGQLPGKTMEREGIRDRADPAERGSPPKTFCIEPQPLQINLCGRGGKCLGEDRDPADELWSCSRVEQCSLQIRYVRIAVSFGADRKRS